MLCETCLVEHKGTYGSGRFCSSFCARKFSTCASRKEINEKVSLKLSKWKTCPKCKSRFLKRNGKSSRCTSCGPHVKHTFETGSISIKKAILLQERGRRCETCGRKSWMGKQIPIQLDHTDGNPDNNSRENLKLLCPNCHAQTPSFGWKNRGRFPNSERKRLIRERWRKS